jgi:hypothetical protein
LRHAAVRQLGHVPELLATINRSTLTDPQQRIGLLLAHRASGRPEVADLAREFFTDPDDDVRLLAAKWAADDKLSAVRPMLAEALDAGRLNVRLHLAYATALARIDGRPVNEAALADAFVRRLTDDRTPPAQRAAALRLVPVSHRGLTPDLLGRLLAQDDPGLQLEVVRSICEQPIPRRVPLLLDVARNPRLDDNVRAHALVGLSERSQELADELLALAREPRPALRDEALRALTGTRLTDDQRHELESLALRQLQAAPLTARVLGQSYAVDRPTSENLDAWLKRLDGPADAAAGRRVFFDAKLGVCLRCHRAEGRGHEGGPDLSNIGRSERRSILESVLRPGVRVAPHYQSWRVETADGKNRIGLLVHTNYDECTYVDANGETFKVNTRNVVASEPVAGSIMPDGLADRFTDQEMRDLLAYLCSLR